ncbi:MAG: hypothetical protein RSA20_04550 [Oscillospiraceae bacterium]
MAALAAWRLGWLGGLCGFAEVIFGSLGAAWQLCGLRALAALTAWRLGGLAA